MPVASQACQSPTIGVPPGRGRTGGHWGRFLLAVRAKIAPRRLAVLAPVWASCFGLLVGRALGLGLHHAIAPTRPGRWTPVVVAGAVALAGSSFWSLSRLLGRARRRYLERGEDLEDQITRAIEHALTTPLVASPVRRWVSRLPIDLDGKHQDPWGESGRYRRLNVQTASSNARSPSCRKTDSAVDPTDFGDVAPEERTPERAPPQLLGGTSSFII